MMGTLEEVIAKVQKLRRLAQSDNVNEAAAAAAAADRLMQDHGIAEAALEAAGEKPPEEIGESPDPVMQWTGKQPAWESHLVWGLIRHYGCSGYQNTARSHFGHDRRVTARIIGRPSDIELVRYMWAWLRHEIGRLADMHKGQGRSWLDSFRKGAVRGVLEKMNESKKAASDAVQVAQAIERTLGHDTSNTTAALVLYQHRGDEAVKVRDKLYPKLRSARSTASVSDSGAYGAGREAGRNIHTGAALSGGKAPRRLGS